MTRLHVHSWPWPSVKVHLKRITVIDPRRCLACQTGGGALIRRRARGPYLHATGALYGVISVAVWGGGAGGVDGSWVELTR